MVGLYEHNENVYNLVRPETPTEPRPPRYESKSARAVRSEAREGKHAHRTLGEARADPPPPEQFLRKQTRDLKFRQRAKSARAHREIRSHCDERRPTVPRVTDHVATPLRHRRNFVARNAIDAMCAGGSSNNNTDDSDEHFVDAPDGHTQSLAKSGMKPIFSRQKSFGHIPRYLERYKSERAEEEARWEAERRAERERMEKMKLSDQEREGILEGLRANWSDCHHQYQKLSLLTDTLPKKLRREQLEAQLDQLEKFVALIERHPVIIVSDDPYLSF